jgi:thioredoxin reductase (NADPH)
MATPLPGLYVAGVIASGFDANKIFIENGRDHGDRIAADVLATARAMSSTSMPIPSSHH